MFSGKYIRYNNKLFVDIIDYLFAHRVFDNRSLPMDEQINSVYGEFLWIGAVSNALNEFEDGVVDDGGWIVDGNGGQFLRDLKDMDAELVYNKYRDEFRALVIRKIVGEILDADEIEEYVAKATDSVYNDSDNYISYDDIGTFFGLIAKNKIRADKEFQANKHGVYFYKHVTDAARWYAGVGDVTNALIEEQLDRNPTKVLDYFDERIYFTKEFEELEKRNWKKNVDEKYHKAIDAVDLTALKQNLIDPISGKCFTPLGWQGEFLLNHSRFNFIAGSRRIGKTFLGAGYLTIRQMSLPGQIVIYIVPTKENHAKPAWRDMELYFKRFENIRMV